MTIPMRMTSSITLPISTCPVLGTRRSQDAASIPTLLPKTRPEHLAQGHSAPRWLSWDYIAWRAHRMNLTRPHPVLPGLSYHCHLGTGRAGWGERTQANGGRSLRGSKDRNCLSDYILTQRKVHRLGMQQCPFP